MCGHEIVHVRRTGVSGPHKSGVVDIQILRFVFNLHHSGTQNVWVPEIFLNLHHSGTQVFLDNVAGTKAPRS